MGSEKTNRPSSRYAYDIHNTHQRLPSPRHIHNSVDSVLPYPDTLLSALNLLDPIPPATNRAFTLADLSPKTFKLPLTHSFPMSLPGSYLYSFNPHASD